MGVGPNTLVLRIQPDEKIWLTFGVKRPGNTMNMEQAELLFDYKKHFGASSPDAYVRLLADAIAGDQTLFLRGDEIEASWEYADSVRKAWQESEVDPILEYPAGSWGPEEANALFADEEGEWSRGRDESD